MLFLILCALTHVGSDVIKTFFKTNYLNFKTKTLKILSRPRPSLVFKTKTKTLHLKTKTFLWCILEADRKVFFIFGRKRKCRRKINSIYGRKRNENINGRSFSQTQRAGCSKAEPKNFAPPQTAFPEARDGQNLISWRWSLPLHTLNQFGEDRCTQFRVIMVTDPRHPPTHKHTHPQKKKPFGFLFVNTVFKCN